MWSWSKECATTHPHLGAMVSRPCRNSGAQGCESGRPVRTGRCGSWKLSNCLNEGPQLLGKDARAPGRKRCGNRHQASCSCTTRKRSRVAHDRYLVVMGESGARGTVSRPGAGRAVAAFLASADARSGEFDSDRRKAATGFFGAPCLPQRFVATACDNGPMGRAALEMSKAIQFPFAAVVTSWY